jgi:hypothetical protein
MTRASRIGVNIRGTLWTRNTERITISPPPSRSEKERHFRVGGATQTGNLCAVRNGKRRRR